MTQAVSGVYFKGASPAATPVPYNPKPDKDGPARLNASPVPSKPKPGSVSGK